MSEDQRLVADLVVEGLGAWGIQRVFGHPGDGINTVLGATRRAGDAPAFVQARHEENAALMGVGHAKYTGGVGVVVSTQGPGAVHLLNGLYDAKLDNVPVVAVVGQQEGRWFGRGPSALPGSLPVWWLAHSGVLIAWRFVPSRQRDRRSRTVSGREADEIADLVS
jgi:hypothetical protein